MNGTITCDIAIIGAGPGGLTIAAIAAQLGLKVVLVESNRMGGDCLNSGCVPSKSLIAAAKSAHEFLQSGKFGVEPVEPQVDFAKVLAHVAGVINTISPHDSIERFTKMGVNVIHAQAKFLDEKTIIANDIRIRAWRFVIATGSSPAVPPIPGLDQVPFFTNENIFTLKERPAHLVIIGGGPIGCELAQAFLYLGIKVTVLEAFKMLPRDESDLVAVLREQFKIQGLMLHENIKVLAVKKIGNSIEIQIEKNGIKEIITGSHLLIAAGRHANVDNLDLEKANVAFTGKGIKVNNRLRTKNKIIYAIGDVIGGYQFTHIANYHASIVIRNVIFKLPSSVSYRAIPWVTYTTPELAHVGLTSDEAFSKDPTTRIVALNLHENDRAQTERETQGKIKVIVTATGKILGVSILAQHAGELILPWIMLIQDKKTLRSLTDIIIPYPTLSEISKQVASEFYKPKLFSKPMRYLVAFLKWI